MLSINECCDATKSLAVCDRVKCKGGLTGRFWTVDFNYATTWQAANTQSDVQCNRTGWDGLNWNAIFLAELHD